MKKLVPTVAAIAVHGGKFLLVQHEKGAGHITGTYGLPSGRVGENESESEAAVREFYEETGLNAKLEDFREFDGNYYIADLQRKDGSIMHCGWRVFKVLKFEGEIRASSETTPVWLNLEEIKKLGKEEKLLPNILDAIHAALNA